MLVLIEGMDFSGKTTILNHLVMQLTVKGYAVQALEGGSLTGGLVRTIILRATEDHRYPRWIQRSIHRSVAWIDRICYRKPSSEIILHTSYIDRSLAYEMACGSTIGVFWMRIARRIAIKHDIRIMLTTDTETRIRRYMDTGSKNDYDDRRFFTQYGLNQFHRMERALNILSQDSGYYYINNTNLSINETVSIIIGIIQDTIQHTATYHHRVM